MLSIYDNGMTMVLQKRKNQKGKFYVEADWANISTQSGAQTGGCNIVRKANQKM